MKTFPLLALCLSGLLLRAGEATPASARQFDTLRVVVAGNTGTSVVTRVTTFFRSAFPLTVQLETAAIPEGLDLVGAAKLGGSASNDYLKVVLFDAPASEPRHGLFDPTNRVMTLNTTVLHHDNPETFARRLDRQFTRGMCFSLGMPTCPNPMCGLFPYKDLAELDMIGRGACPPCQFRANDAAKQKGVVLKFPPPRRPAPRTPPDNAPPNPAPPSAPAVTPPPAPQP
ncbi:MAG: hypothetical protein U1F77_11565 [Kiritimatiellia bacterium]